MELKRLLNLAETLDCWVTVYPSIRHDDVQFVVQVTDADDFVRTTTKSFELDRACVAAVTILQEGIQKGGFD